MELRLLPPSPKQARSIRLATARINIWHGAVRSGKTVASQIKWADVCRQHDGNGDLVMVGKTERTLKRNVLLPLMRMLGPKAMSLTEGKGEARIYDKTVYLIGANDERSEQKIRGGTFAKIYGDELTLWPESFFKMSLSRMSVPGAQLFGTTNPDSPMHYIKRDFIDREDEMNAKRPGNMRSFHFSLRDNYTLDDAYLDAIEQEYTGLWRKRFIEGLWVMAEGAIWDSFDTDVHVTPLPADVEFARYFVGVDYGTANAFVALLFGVGSDGRIWVVDEWRWDSRKQTRQMTDAEYSAAMAAWIKGHGIMPSAVYVDPSAASFILQLRRDHAWSVVEADNDVADGLRCVAKMISDDGLRMVKGKTEDTQDEMLGYVWDPKKQEKGKDEPIKQADHGPDALRYGLYSHVRRDIGDLKQYGWMA